MKKIIVLIGILILAGVAVWCLVFFRSGEKKYTGPIEKVSLGAYQGEFSGLIWVAQEHGDFKNNGLDVTVTEFDTGIAPTTKLLEGQFDFSTGADFAAVRKIFDDQRLRIMCTIDLPKAIEVVAKKSSGILAPGDLAGKRVGVVSKSQAEFLLGEFLISNRMTYSDVSVAGYNQVAEMKDAFLDGALDAVVVWNPYAYEFAKALGEDALSWNAQDHQLFYFLALTRADIIAARPQVVTRFIQALLDAEQYIGQHNDEAQAIVRDHGGYDEAYIESVWGKNQYSVQLPQDLILAMENEARWAMANKVVNAAEIPNYLDFVYTDALETSKPAALTIIK
jgi:NitT/TauT family transport system substrate-binding protein